MLSDLMGKDKFSIVGSLFTGRQVFCYWIKTTGLYIVNTTVNTTVTVYKQSLLAAHV